MIYYNENDPKAAAWLRVLIDQGHLPYGFVDTRSIEDVKAEDLRGYEQCHFFAGIGGWPLALKLAGWPDDKPVWTGSCPCQPFSVANSRRRQTDSRHLYPVWAKLIKERKPAVVFGEQVASPLGLNWLDSVFADLEEQDYACAAADLCAAGVGAPHIRQRLYWVALAGGERQQGVGLHVRGRGSQQGIAEAGGSSEAGHVGHPSRTGSWRNTGAILGPKAGPEGSVWGVTDFPIPTGTVGFMADSHGARPQGWRQRRKRSDKRATWTHSLVGCRDGKWRPIEPGTFPLAHGVPGRVGLLRGYGNAIVPQVAQAFIESVMEIAA